MCQERSLINKAMNENITKKLCCISQLSDMLTGLNLD